MEGNGGRKRPSCVLSPPQQAPPVAHLRDEHEDENDDEKVEKFYALIGQIKAMRDLWKTNKRSKSEISSGSGLGSMWKPKFELEDFQQENQIRRNQRGNGEETVKVEEEEDGKDKSNLIDLNLAL